MPKDYEVFQPMSNLQTNASRVTAADFDFAVDVTEPRHVQLKRFEDLILKLRVQAVYETLDSLSKGGWLSEDDMDHITATLPGR